MSECSVTATVKKKNRTNRKDLDGGSGEDRAEFLAEESAWTKAQGGSNMASRTRPK